LNISLVERTLTGFTEVFDVDTIVNLITIYGKSEVDNMSDKEWKDLIKASKKQRVNELHADISLNKWKQKNPGH